MGNYTRFYRTRRRSVWRCRPSCSKSLTAALLLEERHIFTQGNQINCYLLQYLQVDNLFYFTLILLIDDLFYFLFGN